MFSEVQVKIIGVFEKHKQDNPKFYDGKIMNNQQPSMLGKINIKSQPLKQNSNQFCQNLIPPVKPFHPVIQCSFKSQTENSKTNWQTFSKLHHQYLILFNQPHFQCLKYLKTCSISFIFFIKPLFL